MRGRPRVDPLVRFMAKIERTGDHWKWLGAFNHTARLDVPFFWNGERAVNARRFIYNDANGPLAAGTEVRVGCSMPECVGPHHLIGVPAPERKGNRTARYHAARRVCSVCSAPLQRTVRGRLTPHYKHAICPSCLTKETAVPERVINWGDVP